MSTQREDPVLRQLKEISEKQDITIQKQEKLDERLEQIHQDCKAVARTNGAIAGGIAGGMVAAAISFIKSKLGVM